jgi:flagellar assembly factor FliW
MRRARPGVKPEGSKPQMVGGKVVDREDVIAFPEGLPGFEACRGFVLLSSPEMAPLQQLQSVVGPGSSFIGIDPKHVLRSYRYELSAMDRQRLGAKDDGALLWLALVAFGPEGEPTVNLRAPIVINPRTMTGCQLMPHNCLYPLRHPLTGRE